MPTAIENLVDDLVASPDFQKRFRILQESAARQQLRQDYESLPPRELSWALLHASLLALVRKDRERHLAQKMCAMIYQLAGENQLVRYALQAITSRLGNFPTIEFSHAFKEDKITQLFATESSGTFGVDPSIKASLASEREMSAYNIGNSTKFFTVDQRLVMDALESKSLVSFSAPTSFGKSFVVRLFIFNQYVKGNIEKSLIILPTKALIDDFLKELVGAKAEYDLDYQVITHTRSLVEMPRRVIFVLTQERLSYILANQPDFIRQLNLVYCDEAHSISRGYRGFVLQNALRQVVRLAPARDGVKYIFSSPQIKNPEYFKQAFFPDLAPDRAGHLKIELSSVEKTTYTVQKSGQSYRYSLLLDETLDDRSFRDRLVHITGRIPYGEISEHGHEGTILKDLRAVLGFGDQDKNLLYTQSPQEAHKYGFYLARLLPEPSESSGDIADFSRYTRDHFDERFGLAELMRRGIGLHYGPMPIGLRRYIVDQFEKGKLKYLICTSTLLEGVNLPAKNIFVFSTSRDRGHSHTPLSFKNLIGRAGRISFGLSGNVVCVGDAVEQYKELLQSPTQDIEPPQNEVLDPEARKSRLLRTILEGSFEYVNDRRRRADVEYVIFELLTSANPRSILSTTNLTESEIDTLLNKIPEIAGGFLATPGLISKNPGIDPRFQDFLYKFAMADQNQAQVLECFQIISNVRGLSRERLYKLLRLSHQFLKWPHTLPQAELIAGRIAQWVHEQTLSAFIAQRIQGARLENPELSELETINEALDEIKFLEREISFEAPKFLKCVLDLLAHSIIGTQQENLEEKIENFLFSIESGTTSQITRLLFEKGVARSVAIKVKEILEDTLGNRPIDISTFFQQEIRDALKNSLSKIAYSELYEHLA